MGERRAPENLRSARWLARDDLRAHVHRARAMQMGYSPEDWAGRPVIAVLNTWSDINPCHAHFRHRVEDVKRGVLQAGGFPLELPAISLAETFVKPTTMLYRNMLAMECEELLRSHPVDGAVLMGGCDKTTPALLMGAISAGYPAIYLPGGPQINGTWRGARLGSGSDAWKYWDELRAGAIDEATWNGILAGTNRSYGHCMTMGTASTMTGIVDAMGMTLTGGSSIPAPDANHIRLAAASGRRIVEMVWEDVTPEKIVTREAVENGLTAALAMGCSTNAVIHLIAIARRAGVPLSLDDFDRAGRKVPVLANVRPSGAKYLMQDFHEAGGLRALLSRLADHLHLDATTVSGRSLGEELYGAEVYDEDVIRPFHSPVYAEGAIAVLKGNLAPHGAVIKPAACDKRFLHHRGPALVFDSYPEMKAALEDENLKVGADHVLILRNAGPLGGPGMPEWGMLPIPKKLLARGVRDILRISDARMSGTSYGACILHVAPEAHIGGPLALVRTGDIVAVDVAARRLDMEVCEAELSERRRRWQTPEPPYARGYGWMFARHVTQADEGCDLDFLERDFGAPVEEPAIY
ncbi:L-arabinonate dehydratase [Afifella pfennigii]|uniref:L-arabinonate dehydratase n=1 Tax=Afifella pfennigii TaxID=209897 RepID=UPI00047D2085|nr:L-arabinonate dehydratase [Afifella pfennigii]